MKKVLRLINMIYLTLLTLGVISMLFVLLAKDRVVTLFANNKKRVLAKSKNIQRRRKSTRYIITNYSQPAL
jgi:hypothetical protein